MKKYLLLGLFFALCLPMSLLAQQREVIDDKDINVRNYVDLDYPMMALVAHAQGVVVVRVALDGNGKVLDAVVLSGAALLAAASVENSRKWEFTPNPGKTALIIYNFRIDGECRHHASHSTVLFYPPNFLSITACSSSEIRTTD